jgi:hypothetical protein
MIAIIALRDANADGPFPPLHIVRTRNCIRQL